MTNPGWFCVVVGSMTQGLPIMPASICLSISALAFQVDRDEWIGEQAPSSQTLTEKPWLSCLKTMTLYMF